MSNRDEIIEAMARGICETRLWPGAWDSTTDVEGERRTLIEDAAAALAAFEAVMGFAADEISALFAKAYGDYLVGDGQNALEVVAAEAKAARRACEWYAEENAALRSRLAVVKESLADVVARLVGAFPAMETFPPILKARAALSDAPAPKGQSDD